MDLSVFICPIPDEIQTNFSVKHQSFIYGKIHVRNSEHDHIHSDDNALVDDDRGNDIRDSHVHIHHGIPHDNLLHTPGHDHTRPLVCDDGGGLVHGDGQARNGGQVRDGVGVHDGDELEENGGPGIPPDDRISGQGVDHQEDPAVGDLGCH